MFVGLIGITLPLADRTPATESVNQREAGGNVMVAGACRGHGVLPPRNAGFRHGRTRKNTEGRGRGNDRVAPRQGFVFLRASFPGALPQAGNVVPLQGGPHATCDGPQKSDQRFSWKPLI